MASSADTPPATSSQIDGPNSENVSPPSSNLNTSSGIVAHPQAAEIIRQVEFYLGDENLPHDEHLLGLFKEGKGSVSLNEICGFMKMRGFKPKTAVREAIRQSTLVAVSRDGKRLMRKYLLDKSLITVLPKINPNRKKMVIPEDKPWLTKAMLKPTGFESFVTDGPISPEVFEQERNDYDPENSFTSRIEIAVTRFCAKRKMHQQTLQIFSKFVIFGGMEGGQRQFTGGVDEKAMEDYTKKEIAEMTSYWGVSDRVLDGIYHDHGDDKEATWIVDFEAVAKAFLSSQFTNFFHWYNEDQVLTATNVLRNFYNYLLRHDVCLEYVDQLHAARDVCDKAEDELLKLTVVDRQMPGGFNSACSTLFGGNYAGLHPSGDWYKEGNNVGWSYRNAELVFMVGIFAHATEDQQLQVESAKAQDISWKTAFKVVSEERIGLEIIGVELANGAAKEVYNDPRIEDTFLRSMGKLKCVRWQVPHAAPVDLPRSVVNAKKTQEFNFLVEDEILKFCVPGMKFECCVKELDIGVKWIDHIEATYASFFVWLMNERIRDWKEPQAPKQWMERKLTEDGTVPLQALGADDDEDMEGSMNEMD